MLVATNAIVISAIKYGESDLIAKLFTETQGVKTYMLRGVLKSKKGKLRISFFQPLMQLQIEAYHKNKGTLERIKDAKVIVHYQTLHTDIIKSSLVLFLSEILKNVIQEEEANPELYQYLASSFQYLDTTENYTNFHILFLLKLLMYLGCYPDDSAIELPYFNLADGLFQDEITTIYCEKGSVVTTLKQFFGINFDDAHHIKLSKDERSGALNLLLLYYKLHLHGFKKPKSLEVLQQLFN